VGKLGQLRTYFLILQSFATQADLPRSGSKEDLVAVDEREGVKPGEHHDGGRSLPGPSAETSVAKLPTSACSLRAMLIKLLKRYDGGTHGITTSP